MSAFLKDLSRFYGTGERNQAGQTLEEFLEGYDPYKYRTPSCTADAVIFSAREPLTKELTGIKILLVKRSNHPSIGFWALPGGFVNMEENLEESAKRELLEETGIGNLAMEQIAAYGNYDRDPRTRVITTAYMALVQGEERKACAGDDAADAVWCGLTLEKIKSERQLCGAGQQETEITSYRLHVKNQEKDLDTCAVVEQKRHLGLIREESFEVKECGMLAVDHAAIIVQALTILQERCG
ncbi:MAG: NUDIX hydrolase [Ruminococcus sp.]|nr:NUDIX hydrolase [Ruminococcus sp.]